MLAPVSVYKRICNTEGHSTILESQRYRASDATEDRMQDRIHASSVSAYTGDLEPLAIR